jgi:hypothetical protein
MADLEGLVHESHVSEPTRSTILEVIREGADEATVRLMLAGAVAEGHALRHRFVSDRSRSTPNSPLVRPRRFEF